MKTILRFLRNDDGPTAVEYAVMLALVIIVCIVGVLALGTQTGASYTNSANAIDQAMNGGGS